MPLSACSNSPILSLSAPVKAPRTCPNNSLSNSVSTTAEQFSTTKCPFHRARLVQGSGHQFLTGAGFAGHQHGPVVWRYAANAREHLPHRRTASDHSFELRVLQNAIVDRLARSRRRASSASFAIRSRSSGIETGLFR